MILRKKIGFSDLVLDRMLSLSTALFGVAELAPPYIMIGGSNHSAVRFSGQTKQKTIRYSRLLESSGKPNRRADQFNRLPESKSQKATIKQARNGTDQSLSGYIPANYQGPISGPFQPAQGQNQAPTGIDQPRSSQLMLCSGTIISAQAVYSLLTLHPCVFHVQEQTRSFYEIGIPSLLYR
jgi:hypothetical protein